MEFISIPGLEWKIQNNHLAAFIPSGEELNINALDILRIEKSAENQKKITKIIPDLKLCRFPLSCKLIIEVEKNDNELTITGYYEFSDQLNSIKIRSSSIDYDHIIYKNTFYPIFSEDLIEIKSILQELGLTNLESVSLRTYLNILKTPDYKSYLEIREIAGIRHESPINLNLSLQGLNASLYGYQEIGVSWLKRITSENLGCILADEMGLGKSLQIIALINSELNRHPFPSLILAPSSLLENWRREFKKFAPGIRIYVHAGHNRTGFPQVLESYSVVITSYDTAVIDISMLEMIKWNYLVCDEAQALKNPSAKRTRYVKKIGKRAGIAVTGTPFENRLLDVWSISDLVAEGILGDIKTFESEYPNSIQSAERIEPIISPIILRRKVAEVAKNLPDKIEIPQPIAMDDALTEYYEKCRQEILSNYSKRADLVMLQLLRVFCCDPSLALKDGINYDKVNLKFQRLSELAFEIYKSGEKAIIFTSFQLVSDKICSKLEEDFGCYCKIIDGRTKITDRQAIIDEYTKTSGTAFLVLNPKAAGTGLNITAANHIIHYNLEWNPSVEDQATARAYRRGQEKPVFVYRLFYTNTVEEFIEEKHVAKRTMAEKSIIGISGEENTLLDIYNALQLTPLSKR
jgi:SNF2 family DNA or RNA helicase